MSQPLKRVFITGGTGLLGSHLVAAYRNQYEICYSYHRNKINFSGAQGFYFDLRFPSEVANVINKIHPDVIIHTAAATGIEYCEEHKSETEQINIQGTEALARAAKDSNAHFIYISTEAVYDGDTSSHSEDETPKPANFYALTKLKSEDAVRAQTVKWFIARTGFEGWRSNLTGQKLSFFEWLVNNFEQKKPFDVFHDRYFTPFSVPNLAQVLNEVIQKNIQGLFNVEGRERLTYLEFAKKVAKIFNYNEELIQPMSVDSFSPGVKRAKDTSLDSTKIQKLISTKLLNAEEIIYELKEFRDSGRLERLRKEILIQEAKIAS